jgi:hypothetical protein
MRKEKQEKSGNRENRDREKVEQGLNMQGKKC